MDESVYQKRMADMRAQVHGYRLERGFPEKSANLTNEQFGMLICEVGRWKDGDGDTRQLGSRWSKQRPWTNGKFNETNRMHLTRAIARAMLFACPSLEVCKFAEEICTAAGTVLFKGFIKALSFSLDEGAAVGSYGIPLREIVAQPGAECALAWYAVDGRPSERVLNHSVSVLEHMFWQLSEATGRLFLCAGISGDAFDIDGEIASATRTARRKLQPDADGAPKHERISTNVGMSAFSFSQAEVFLRAIHNVLIAETPFNALVYQNLVLTTLKVLRDEVLRGQTFTAKHDFVEFDANEMAPIRELMRRERQASKEVPARFCDLPEIPFPEFHVAQAVSAPARRKSTGLNVRNKKNKISDR